MTVSSKKLNVAPGNYFSSNNYFSLNCQKAENFSKTTNQSLIWFHVNMIKLTMTIENVNADKGS